MAAFGQAGNICYLSLFAVSEIEQFHQPPKRTLVTLTLMSFLRIRKSRLRPVGS